MDVLTFETCWAINSEIIKKVTSSWSIFIQPWKVFCLQGVMTAIRSQPLAKGWPNPSAPQTPPQIYQQQPWGTHPPNVRIYVPCNNCYYFRLLTYLLTPWCRVIPEQLTGLQLVKKFPAFHGTRRFTTALTSVRHMSLSWGSPIQSTCPHPTSWRSILILSTHLRLGLPSSLFPSGFPTKTLYTPSPHPYAPHAQPISFFSILSPARYWVSS